MTFFGRRAIADGIGKDEGILEWGVQLTQAKKCQRLPANHPKLRGNMEQILPSSPSKGTSPAEALILDFQRMHCVRIHLPCLRHSFCGTLRQQS